MRSLQLFLLMASARYCAPSGKILLSERFNVCNLQLSSMALAKYCTPMSEM